MEQEKVTQDWQMNNSTGFATGKVIPAGKHLCILDTLRQIRTAINPKYWDKEKKGEMPADGKEFKILFKFRAIEIPCSEGEEAVITKMVRPSNFDRSNCYKLLTEMSPTGQIPQDVLNNTYKYQQWANALVGSYFWCMSKPSDNGKYNNLVSVMIASEADADRAMAKLGMSVADIQPRQSIQETEELSGFEDMPDSNSLPYVYDLSKLAEMPRNKAIVAIEAAGAKEFNGKFRSKTKLDRFAKYLIEDDVGEVDPF